MNANEHAKSKAQRGCKQKMPTDTVVGESERKKNAFEITKYQIKIKYHAKYEQRKKEDQKQSRYTRLYQAFYSWSLLCMHHRFFLSHACWSNISLSLLPSLYLSLLQEWIRESFQIISQSFYCFVDVSRSFANIIMSGWKNTGRRYFRCVLCYLFFICQSKGYGDQSFLHLLMALFVAWSVCKWAFYIMEMTTVFVVVVCCGNVIEILVVIGGCARDVLRRIYILLINN